MNLVEEWPEGLGFHPTEAQLVGCHLRKKLSGKPQTFLLIPELDIYRHDPWDLFSKYNELSALRSDGQECFFFCPQRNNTRSTRQTKHGFWHRTGHDKPVCDQAGNQIGIKKIFVAYKGQQQKGCSCKTDIVMYEYHLNSDVSASTISGQKTFVVCHIFRQKQRKKISSAIQVGQETIVEASPEATIESESQNKSNLDAPESSKSSPQQVQMDQESRLWCHGDWAIDGSYSNLIDSNAPYPPSNGISIMDLGYDNLINTDMPHPPSKSSSLDAPESSKSSPQQVQMDQESRLWCHGDWAIDGSYSNLIDSNAPYPPSNGISIMDLGYDNLINTDMPHPPSKSSNLDAPESSKFSQQLAQMDQESRLWCHGDWAIDGSYSNLIDSNAPYPPSNGISIMDLGYDNLINTDMPHPPSKSSNLNAPESSKSSPQLAQMDQESRLWCHEDGGIDGSYNNLIDSNTPYPPSNGISIMDLGYGNLINTDMPHPPSNGITIMDLGYDNLINANMPPLRDDISTMDMGYDNLINANMPPLRDDISTMDLGYDNLWNFN